MLFNSIPFLLFFIIVFVFYWFVFGKSLKKQNIFLVGCSYFFYACWDWRFMFLLAFSTLLDYVCGLKIHETASRRSKKAWLITTVCINIGLLGFFKYCNFFIGSFADLLHLFGLNTHITTLHIILPLGISFYTFHGLSYILDIYYGRIKPTKNLVDYSLFVSYFPLLVAGPIERATHLLPQIEKARTLTYPKAVDGLKQILWGLFKKIVVADTCAGLVNPIFENYEICTPATLIMGAMLFAIQIYGDFSGYSDIALGTSRLLGIEVLQNFRFPYFSRDIAEFWRRWHISLTSWFKDYLYIPLGGSRGGMVKTIRNVFIIFFVSGFWHGADWTFLFWGGLNAVFILPSVILKRNRRHLDIVAQGQKLPSILELFQITLTFILASFAWIFFRSENISEAFGYIREIFSGSLFMPPTYFSGSVVLFVLIFMLIEWTGREGKYAIERIGVGWGRLPRWIFYYLILLAIWYFADGDGQQFIYFQF